MPSIKEESHTVSPHCILNSVFRLDRDTDEKKTDEVWHDFDRRQIHNGLVKNERQHHSLNQLHMCFMSSSKCFSCFTFIAPSLSSIYLKVISFPVIPQGHPHFNMSALKIFPNVTTNEDKYMFWQCLWCLIKWFVLLNPHKEHWFYLRPPSSMRRLSQFYFYRC